VSHYGYGPGYLRVAGRPVVFVYADVNEGCAMADRWMAANASIGAYIVLKVFPGYRTCSSQPDSWHQYAPDTAASDQAGYSYTISHGFWKRSEAAPRLVRDPTRWAQNVADMTASGEPWQLVTTFNEWGEGSPIESSTATGTTYLDILRTGTLPGPLPVASFTSAPSSPSTGVAVTFGDTSSNSPTAWSWSFGDGSTSTLQNPNHSWATAGTYTVSLIAANASGSRNQATAQVVVTNDMTPPSTPGGLTATAVGPGEIDLAWTASTDNKAVTGYDVYRDGSATPIATLGAGATSYADTTVAPASTHAYTVDAFDAAGNHSALAGPAGATTPDGTVTIVLNPEADTYVDSGSPTVNFGVATFMRVKTNTQVSYLRFDLSGITGTIQSATLSVYANSATSNVYTVRGVGDITWSETGINWNTAPAYSATSSGSSGALVIGARNNINITTLAGPAAGSKLSVALVTTGTTAMNLASRESVNKPQLILVVHP